jgi:integrase/recombinase XerC
VRAAIVRFPRTELDTPDASEVRGLEAHLEMLRLRNLRERSIYDRERHVVRLAAALGKQPLDATVKDLQQWRAGLRLSTASVHGAVSHVQLFYGWALTTGLIPSDPSRRLVKPKLPRRLPRPIGESDLELALRTAGPRIRPWLILAGYLGLRAQEIALLRREDVLDRADPPVLRVSEEAAKGGHARVVPLSSFVLSELRRAGLPRSGWVFPRHDGQSGPNSPGIVSKLCNEHLRGLGIEDNLHALRHRMGTQAYASTQDLRLVAGLMGHADVQTTVGYVAYSQANAVQAMEQLGTLRPSGWE